MGPEVGQSPFNNNMWKNALQDFGAKVDTESTFNDGNGKTLNKNETSAVNNFLLFQAADADGDGKLTDQEKSDSGYTGAYTNLSEATSGDNSEFLQSAFADGFGLDIGNGQTINMKSELSNDHNQDNDKNDFTAEINNQKIIFNNSADENGTSVTNIKNSGNSEAVTITNGEPAATESDEIEVGASDEPAKTSNVKEEEPADPMSKMFDKMMKTMEEDPMKGMMMMYMFNSMMQNPMMMQMMGMNMNQGQGGQSAQGGRPQVQTMFGRAWNPNTGMFGNGLAANSLAKQQRLDNKTARLEARKERRLAKGKDVGSLNTRIDNTSNKLAEEEKYFSTLTQR